MINYTPQNQLSLDLFDHPFETALDPTNRWVTMAKLLPWDDFASIYCKSLNQNYGRKSVDVRTVIAALIIKHYLQLDDRGTIMAIQENIYLQYFCGFRSFTIKPAFDASLFVDIRKRLGKSAFDSFNQFVIEKSETLRDGHSRIEKKSQNSESDESSQSATHKGTLKVDATIADQEITYPNDVKLLNECRENLERMIDILYLESNLDKKPRTYRRNVSLRSCTPLEICKFYYDCACQF